MPPPDGELPAPEGEQPLPSYEAVTYLINHVVSPSQLPQAYNYDAGHEQTLLHVAAQSLQDLRNLVKDEHSETAVFAINTISNLVACQNDDGDVTEIQLRSTLDKITKDALRGALPIQAKAQNAAILITCSFETRLFDFFELSPTNKSIMSCQGRLKRSFPGLSSEVPMAKIQLSDLQTSLSRTISTMSAQAALNAQPQITKNDETHDELRDATHPRVVTDLLMHIVTAMGKPASTVCITKNTRHEVLWNGGELAWVRSPLWLLVRVSLQLVFVRRRKDSDSPVGLYKVFMALMVSRILTMVRAYSTDLGCDLVHTTRAKLGQWLRKIESRKLSEDMKAGWCTSILTNLDETYSTLRHPFDSIIANTFASLDTTVLVDLKPADYIALELSDLDTDLSRLRARAENAASKQFKPDLDFPTFSAADLPIDLSFKYDEGLKIRFLAFEKWVEAHLRSWIAIHYRAKTTCDLLKRLFADYFLSATEVYGGTPESMSNMYLTILDLWVACDKSACALTPLLREFSPEVDLSELQCLSLPLRRQMVRLDAIERYVDRRCSASTKNSPSVFREFGQDSSFAVRYFEKSSELKDLKEEIERKAYEERDAKRKELMDIRPKYEDLMHHHTEGTCDIEQTALEDPQQNGGVPPPAVAEAEQRHSETCARCYLKKQAEDLAIDVHEWPLSPLPSKAKATIFELRIPAHLSAWRDATIYLLVSVLGFRSDIENKTEEQHTLRNHIGLSHLLSPTHTEQRIFPMSWIKPVSKTHYKTKRAVHLLSDSDVCVDNSLRYWYYDNVRKTITEPLASSEEVMKNCMYAIPGGSKTLERYLARTPLTPHGLAPTVLKISRSKSSKPFAMFPMAAIRFT